MRAIITALVALCILAAPLCAGDLTDALKDPRVYGGLIGSVAGSAAATALATALPGGVVTRTVIGLAGGLVGWEVGSLNVLQTDWAKLVVKASVAGLAYVGVQRLLGAHGLPGGGPVAALAGASAALVADRLVDRLRGGDEDLAARHSAWRKAVEAVEKSPDPARLSTLRDREAALRGAVNPR